MSLAEDSTLLARGPWRAMFWLALPVMTEEMANLLVGYTDWWLAGRFLEGESPKAAMSLVAYCLWLVPNFFSMVGIGAQAITARFIGAGNREDASRAANQSLLLGAGISLVGMVLVWTLAEWFARQMQLEPEAAALAARYLRIIAPVIPLIMVEQVVSASLRGAGDAWTGFLAKTLVNALNMFFSAALVVGFGPFPKLGWEGLAIGTAIGHGVGGLLLLVILARGRSGLKLSLAQLKSGGDLVPRIVRIGLPGGIDQLAIIACHLVYAAIINGLGTLSAAAHGMGIQIEALSYLPGSAFMVAAATLSGQSLGAKDAHRAVGGILRCWASAATVMSLAGLIFYFAGHNLAAFFNGGRTDDLTNATADLLKVVAWGCPFHATLMIFTGGLRGAGDTRWPLVVTFAGLISIRLPLAVFLTWDEVPLGSLVLPGAGWGVEGAWIAMVTDIIARSVMITLRFLQGGWRHISV